MKNFYLRKGKYDLDNYLAEQFVVSCRTQMANKTQFDPVSVIVLGTIGYKLAPCISYLPSKLIWPGSWIKAVGQTASLSKH